MKNQVDKKQNENKQTHLVVPLSQTIFLPQTAMGVSYIDKVRTRVYLDSVQRQTDAVCLRGYYEIDLEYHGLEGNRLYKHRVMLPLRAELPGDWLAPLDYEPDELHVIITKPMLRILSPYVLEFGAGLAVDYVGDRLYRDKKTGKEVEISEMTPTEMEPAGAAQTEMRERLSSKFGSPEEPKPYRPASARPDYHLPVWSAAKPAKPQTTDQPAIPEQPAIAAKAEAAKAEAGEKIEQIEKIEKNEKTDNTDNTEKTAKAAQAHADEVALPQVNQGRLRSMLTAAAISRLQSRGEVLREAGSKEAQEVIIMEPKLAAVEAAVKMPISVQVAADDEPAAAKAVEKPAEKPVEQPAEPTSGPSVGTLAEQPAAPVKGTLAGAPVETAAETAAPAQDVQAAGAVAAVQAAQEVQKVQEVQDVQEDQEVREAQTVQAVQQAHKIGDEVKPTVAEEITEEIKAETAAEVAATATETPVKEASAEETPAAAEVMAQAVPDNAAAAAEVAPDKAAADYAEELAAAVSAAVDAVDAVDAGDEVDAVTPEAAAGATVSIANADGVRLRVGLRDAQKIRPVPQAAESVNGQANNRFCLKYYVVKPGDDPMSIALKHNVSLERLRETNKALAQQPELAVGMVLRIPC